jgi:hypothetical protein
VVCGGGGSLSGSVILSGSLGRGGAVMTLGSVMLSGSSGQGGKVCG